ncbi:MAG TPA: hemolysin family protein [Phycisphaerales bacterium]|nr:hemolysin family protein [Phycisphaerales bacterium]
MPEPATESIASSAFLGWEGLDVFLLALLPVLLVLSAFFSGTETALFSMTETERMQLRKRGGIASRAVESLLAQPRMLLITVLLGNMTANVLYFVISSVLTMRAETGLLGGTILAAVTLLTIVLLGEVLPKMLASARRTAFASVAAPLLLTLHNVIAPVRLLLDAIVVVPLSRLTAPREAPPELDEDELHALLEISSRQGVIDPDEQRVLRDVVNLGRLRVRDVMTPRVKMLAVPVGAKRDDVLAIVRETGLTRLPVYRDNLDSIVGILSIKRFLMNAHGPSSGASVFAQAMRSPRYVPAIATLDQLLDHFRTTRSQSAIVVDEFGGTAGVVSVEDVVERLVGDLSSPEPHEARPPRELAPNKWEIDGDISVHDWAEAFGQKLISPRVSTLGGLMIERLGRAPEVGDVVRLGNVELRVTEVDRSRVATAEITLFAQAPERGAAS